MLYQALLLAASAALASAQITYNGSQIICPANMPNGVFCAGDSLSTNIIIRCVNGVAGPGNCNDNLAGDPPVGVNPATCWQTSTTSGDAACAKNCVVYCGSGGCNKGDFTLPNCTPSYTASSSSSVASSTTSSYPTSPTSSSLTTSTYTTVCTTGGTTTTQTFTTTFPCPSSSSAPANNTTYAPTSQSGSASPTKTPSSPPTSAPSGFTGAAATLSPVVGSTLAGLGLMVAYFL